MRHGAGASSVVGTRFLVPLCIRGVAVTILNAPGSRLYSSQPSTLQMKELGLERGGDLPKPGWKAREPA